MVEDEDIAGQMRRLIIEHSLLIAGEIWHPVEARWASRWKAYIGLDPIADDNRIYSSPGPVDNSKIEGDHRLALSKEVQEHKDYILVHDTVWNMIVKEYGGGPDFPRFVITTGVQLHAQIELYPLIIRVTLVDIMSGDPDPGYVYEGLFSPKKLVSSIIEACAPYFFPESRDQQNFDEYRLWYSNPDEFSSQEEPGSQNWLLVDKQDLSTSLLKFDFPSEVNEFLLERKVGEKWPRHVIERDWADFRVGDIIDALDTSSKWYESTIRDVKSDAVLVHYNNWDSKWDEWIAKDNFLRLAKKGTHTNGPYINPRRSTGAGSNWSVGLNDIPGPPIARGAVGLRNCGNTCFMNSTLQCLFQSPILTDYFLDEVYQTQINRSNPLGWQGKIAETYAQLVKDYWYGDARIIVPRDLKQVIGEFQPRFRGYQQQDSSELLSFLLDGLHEDLNRVKDKPLTDTVESNGREDSVVAKEAWDVYKLRNDSIITDCMQGQVKSTLICPDCGKVCIIFDPYMSLSLSLPMDVTVNVPIRLVSENGKRPPTMFIVTIAKTANIEQLLNELSKLADIPSSELVVCDIWNNSISRVYKMADFVDEIRAGDDTWAFHVQLECPCHFSQEFNDEGIPSLENSYEENQAGCAQIPSLVASYVLVPITSFIEPLLSSPPSFLNSEKKKEDIVILPFPVELPIGAEVPGALVRKKVLSIARKIMGIENLDEVAVVVGDRNSGYRQMSAHGRRVGQDLVSVCICGQTALHLIWPTALVNQIRHSEIEKHCSYRAMAEFKSEPTIDLKQCLNIFTKQETLSDTDAWFCPSCNEHRCASKTLEIWKVPDILAIHLKRFQYSGLWRNKISLMVDFPLTGLCLDDWTPNPAMKGRQYDIFAVSNHFGSLGGGHYTAYVKNLVNGRWYNMDDSMVTPIDASNVKTEAAYVLFYSLRTAKD